MQQSRLQSVVLEHTQVAQDDSVRMPAAFPLYTGVLFAHDHLTSCVFQLGHKMAVEVLCGTAYSVVHRDGCQTFG